ncbi:MAG: hypothetical protein ACKO86_17405, partial [Dolichospermum sp.]
MKNQLPIQITYYPLPTIYMEKIQSEIGELRSQIQALQQERAMLTNNHLELSENDSHLAIVEAYRRQARENAQLSA